MKYRKIKNTSDILSHGDLSAREKVLELADRVLSKLDCKDRLNALMHRQGNILFIGEKALDLSKYRRIFAFSAGKAANHMARAFEEILGDYLTLGITIIKVKDSLDVYKKTEIYVGGHPLPNEEGVRGCKRMIEIADSMTADDLLFMGLSGGCSSLMGYPVDGVSLNDLQQATDVMVKSGMWVMDINDIRGHLSKMSRGRLGQHIHGSQIFCFEIWDAVGLDNITDYSKPVPIMGTPVGYDNVSFEDIKKLIREYHLENKLPSSVLNYLMNYNPEDETPKVLLNPVDYYIVNTLPDSSKIAKSAGEQMGITTHVLTTYSEGESCDYGLFLASIAKQIKKSGEPFKTPCFIISAGETTTKISDDDQVCGHGGPSQEMTTAFATLADGLKNTCLLSIDSEGTDGTTEVAGGITDGTTAKTAALRGVDLFNALATHSTNEALSVVGDTVFTGNTGTNLCDLNILYVGNDDE